LHADWLISSLIRLRHGAVYECVLIG